jgi:hypothetical protein
MIATHAAINPAIISRYLIDIMLPDAKSVAIMNSHAFGFFNSFIMKPLTG